MRQTSLGSRIHQLRWQQRLTCRELADKSGVSASTISRIERGWDGSISHLIAIARGLGVSVRYLLLHVNLENDLTIWRTGDKNDTRERSPECNAD